ncbi:hypothetical protein BHE74_00030276 [Ensete ventricosum]|nr:hypothetical protein GW17_00000651 [Ensete ventricosum]RWW62586.1 hypothetical protein BHE74_00030276 [Ensete ventricosum]
MLNLWAHKMQYAMPHVLSSVKWSVQAISIAQVLRMVACKQRRGTMVVLRRVGKYEVGRTIGEGTFAKVKFAQNTETGESVAMKVLDRATIIKHNMVDQIKREISIMKLVRHPYVVRLHEV